MKIIKNIITFILITFFVSIFHDVNGQVTNIKQIKGLGNSEQVILVTTEGYNQFKAKLELYEKINGEWRKKTDTMDAVVGKDGFTTNMMETVKQSPEGIYTLTKSFGKYKNPSTLLPYTKTTKNDYWIDDPKSKFYNTWQKGPADGRWNSAEELLRKDSLYDYAVVIDFNIDSIPGKGSAIFLHVWKDENSYTAGCTAVSKQDLVKIMKWLDPSKKPIIIQSVKGNLNNMKDNK